MTEALTSIHDHPLNKTAKAIMARTSNPCPETTSPEVFQPILMLALTTVPEGMEDSPAAVLIATLSLLRPRETLDYLAEWLTPEELLEMDTPEDAGQLVLNLLETW